MNRNFSLLASLIVAACVVSPSARAGLAFVGNSYAILDNNGGGDSYYDVSNQGNDGSTPNYVGQTFTIQSGQSLLIGGQTQSYPQEFGTTAWMGYDLYQGATLISSDTDINLPYNGNNGNNNEWQQLASTSGVNLDSGLALGTYTLKVWFGASNTDGSSGNDNNGGANYSATLSVVPEPIYPALIAFAGLLAVVRFGRPVYQKFQLVSAL